MGCPVWVEGDDDIIPIEAASFSLGLCTDANTHLARLQEFGDKHFLDQRQARRYSDRGLLQLARLISSHWTTQTVPEATLIVVGIDSTQIGLSVQLKRQHHVDMHEPKLSLRQGDVSADAPTPLAAQWRRTSTDGAVWVEDELTEPVVVRLIGETTIRIVWHGETWPKFTVVLTGDIDAEMVRSETLGAACALTMARVGASECHGSHHSK